MVILYSQNKNKSNDVLNLLLYCELNMFYVTCNYRNNVMKLTVTLLNITLVR